ncbi:MAG: pyruvate kinase [Desulfarculus sp.]|nr:pyruvate kinase [Desulfarculus sp.]
MPNSSLPRKTKIVCTIGPATHTPSQLAGLIRAGMDVARLNFSHGDHDSHRRVLADLRQVAAQEGRQVGILQDLSGPKIRLGLLEGEVELDTGQEVVLVEGETAPPGCLPVNHEYFFEDVNQGDRILLADGLVEMVVIAKRDHSVICQVTAGGVLSSHKGVNLPTSQLRTAAFTDKDRRDLALGLELGVDFVAMSFVRHEDDLAPLLEIINQQRPRPMLIAKIEKPGAMDRLAQILAVVDGVMVARGDLGVEMPLEEVPLIQKRIIKMARQAGKPVITATQMLRSMIESPRPTRAEVTDVANAILDGTDAVMLSDETAVGAHTLEAAAALHSIARATEKALLGQSYLKEPLSDLLPSTSAAISRAACWLAADLKAKAIVASTTSGGTARLVARYRTAAPVVGLSADPATCRQLNLSWGVLPALVEDYSTSDEMFERALQWVKTTGLAGAGDRLVFTAGVPHGTGRTNLVKVVDL